MSNKFQIQIVVDIEMDVDEAAHLLSDPDPKRAVNDYFVTRHNTVIPPFVGTYNSDRVRAALGEYLAGKRIEAERQLPLSSGAKEVA